MDAPEDLKIAYHSGVVKRCEELVEELFGQIQDFGSIEQSAPSTIDIHPVANLGPADITSGPKFIKLVDGLGEPAGVWWPSQKRRVGWDGEAFQHIRRLVDLLVKPVSAQVSVDFLLDEICSWLIDTLGRKRADKIVRLYRKWLQRAHQRLRDLVSALSYLLAYRI